MKMHRLDKLRRSIRPLRPAQDRGFETLESRNLLAIDGALWQNPYVSEDVNGDFLVTPADVLKLIDAINRGGTGTLDVSASPALVRGSSDSLSFGKAQYLDVTGDGQLLPNDLLVVIDKVNRAALVADPDTMDLTAQAFDVAGNPISEILVGTDFLIGLVVEDTRPTPSGVFSAYADVTLDNTALASFNSGPLSATPELTFHPQFAVGRTGTIIEPTVEVDDAGAINAGGAINAPVVLWTTTMTANNAGTMTFTPNPADSPIASNLLVYDPNNPGEFAVGTYLATSLDAVAATAPSLSINDATVNEVDSGSVDATFTVTLSGSSTRDVYVIYSTSDATATSGDDYTDRVSQTLTFLAGGPTQQTVNVSVLSDTVFEGDETFNVNLLFASNATIGDGVGLGTIVDNDPGPLISVSDAQVQEGDLGTFSDMVFTIALDQVWTSDVIVTYTTEDVTATDGLDYVGASGTLTFAIGETSKEVVVPVIGDVTVETNETFNLKLVTVTNALVAKGIGVGTIIEDDAPPLVSVADTQVVEGNSGSTNMAFNVTLNHITSDVVVVDYTTVPVTATEIGDYTPQTGQVTFQPGETSKPVLVPVIGDTLFEGNETFELHLTAVTNASINDGIATGTIIDDEAAPLINVSDPQLVEGSSGTTSMTFIVSLSFSTSVTVTANYFTQDVTANAPSDYTAQSGVLTFTPGQTSQLVQVPIVGDLVFEGNETFNLILGSASNAIIGKGVGVGTILDDDNAPLLRVSDAQADEPNSGTTNMVFTVTLSPASSINVIVGYATLDDSARAGLDYVAQSGQLTFTPGQTSQQVIVPIIGDILTEGVEQFFLNLSSPVNAAIADDRGVGVIIDNESQGFSVANASVTEGNTGTTQMNFVVSLAQPVPQQTTVVFSTQDGTATIADADYVAKTVTLTFLPNEITQTVPVTINGDSNIEPDESFSVLLSNPTNTSLLNPNATGTILDDGDVGANSFQINNVSVTEGNAGPTSATFTVTWFNPDSNNTTGASVAFNTVTGTATTADGDYSPTSGILTFAVGETTKTITVLVNGDTKFEADEAFTVVLSNPTNGTTISRSVGTGTILNDDPAPPPAGVSGYVYLDTSNFGIKDPGELGLAGVYVTVTSEDGTLSRTTTTNAAGFYQFLALPPAKYFITETQPGFYVDGLEVPPPLPPGVTIAANDKYALDSLVNSTVTDLNFAERGIRADFLALSLSRRFFLASTINNPQNGIGSPIVNADLTKGDIWISFDGGWDGLRKFQAFFPSGSVSLKLYDFDFRGDLHLLTQAQLVDGGSMSWVDALETPAKPLFLQISGTSTNASVKIIDTLRVITQTVAEGNSASNVTLTVKLSGPQTAPVVVQYATANNTATTNAPADYTATTGTLTFGVGETSKQISVPILGDLLDEDNESFFVNLSSASSFVEVAPGPFAVTIIDDDQSPKLNIGDAVLVEGNTTSTSAIFNVTLSAPSGRQVTVTYTTAAGTAVANGDFTPVTGTLTFAPGVIAQSIAVPVLGDTFLEGDETFSVVLGSAVNANILDGVGLGTITNDDAGPQLSSLSAPTGSGFLAATESSESEFSSSSTTTAVPATSSTTLSTSGYTRNVASRGRTATGAVDAAMADEEDWLLVA